MTDYIKREDAVRRIAVLMAAEAESDGCEDQPMDNFIEYALEDLVDIPSADVAPVRHGRWIRNDNETYSCSRCHSWIPKEQHYYAKYCLYCGAKMDGDADD